MLIKVIEDYELYAFDRGEYPTWYSGRPVPARRPAEAQRSYDRPMRPSYISYGLLYVLADQNDTYERIAAKAGAAASREPKNKEASARYTTYPVRVGDSMHDISQRYGIRLDRLYKLNNKDADYAPEEGDVLRLR